MQKPECPQAKPYVLKMEPGTYFWCACGRSKSQPFCDGSHKGSGFTPRKTEITEEKNIAWCGCKMTESYPFCDGTHKRISLA